MKILWMSDSPTSPSGFGNVTRFVCAGLTDRGHQVSILGWQTRGQPTSWHNCILYPIRHNGFGADVLLNYLRRLQPDILVTLADVWWLTYITYPAIANFMHAANIAWALYYPIDGDMGKDQLPPSWVHILKTVDLPISMSRYGHGVTQANGVTPAYIPHGVDTRVFQPPTDKRRAKQALGYEGRFVILSDARNQPRKLLPRTLEIFRRFAADKDDVLLHLHCDPDDPVARSTGYCYDLRSDIAFLGLTDKVQITDGMSIATGLPIAQLAEIYQAADVHLLSSWGEGFGLPTLQAAATGVVPLASEYTASRELVLGHGEAIRTGHFLLDQFGLRRALIDIDDAVSRLEHLYYDPELLASKAQDARRFAEAYDWERIVLQWQEVLQHEVPRTRTNLRYPAYASRVTLHPKTVDGPADLARVVRKAVPSLPDNVQVTVNVVERKVGTLAAEVFQDAQDFDRTLTLPVTLPLVEPKLVKARVIGCVYAASVWDIPVVQALSRVFPRLNVWSTVALELGPNPTNGQPVQAKTVQTGSPEYRSHLATSTLALDIGGTDQALPVQAAELGVPCIGLAQHVEQMRLWPDLSIANSNTGVAAELGRWMLTDQGAASDLCVRASQMLNGILTAVRERESG